MSTTKENKPLELGAGQSLQERPMSAIIPSIMGDNLGLSQVDTRSASATSGGGRQHKLKQRFTVIRKLGKGTYGKVQLAINKETGQEVAIKTIKKTKIDSEQDLERVRREIQIMSSIEHPHIIHIYEVFENKDKIVLIMQYAPGGELYEYVSQSKGLDEQEARRLFRQIATAIFYCHQNKICHRDLKLENILLDEKNNAKLADFGLSNVFDQSYQLKTFCGSPLYASPEIVQGSPYEGPEVDCWSLGVLLYTLVYGAMPFDGSNFKRLVRQISEANYHEPKQRSQASPLIAKLLCADPAKRASIRDICLDPWVNGRAMANSSPRLSPTPLTASSSNGGSQHPPLLNVAQDMANLTPVRLDILLTLTRNSVNPQQRQQQQKAPDMFETSADSRVEIAEAEREHDEEDKPEGHDVALQQDLEMTDDRPGTEMMNVDETQPNSHVANYVIRDLEPDKSCEIAEQNESSLTKEELNLELSQSETQQMEMESHQEIDVESMGMQLDVSEVGVNLETEPTYEGGADEPAVTKIEVEMDLEVGAKVEPATETKSEPSESNYSSKVDDILRAEQTVETPASVTRLEVSEEAPPVAEAAQVEVDQAAESKIEATAGGQVSPSGAPLVEGPSEGKFKRVRKRIVLVKKKKKVPKKETGDKDQSAEPEDEAARDTANSDRTPDGRASAAPSVGSGPGKVRIPETFQPVAAEPGAESGEQQGHMKPVITRRQSALIADVSQRLLQLQQLDTSQSSGTSAIEQDQHQLASVRVSDTKSEFERRASLAAPAASSLTPSSPKRIDPSPTPPAQNEHLKAEPYEIKLEQVNSMLISGQPVMKEQPIEAQQLNVTCSGGPILSEPQTPTNSQQQRFPLASDETMARRSDHLSAELQKASREGERSDSVETIKADNLDGRKSAADDIQQENVRSDPIGKDKVRSSLQINLKTTSQELEGRDASRFSRATPTPSFEPAPITRSYKRVTFMKDGARVTETGRIYSTRDHDGTLRHVERKSKVTHYPSGADHPAGDTRTNEATTREEVVYEFDQPLQWREPRLRRRDQTRLGHRLERLVMPAEAEDEDEYFGGHSESNFDEQSGQFGARDRTGSWSSCSSGSTDVFDDIFDTWTGAISMFNQGKHLVGLRGNLLRHRPFGNFKSSLTRLNQQDRPQSSGIEGANLYFQEPVPPRGQQQQAYRECASTRPPDQSAFCARPKRHRSRCNSGRAWPQAGSVGSGRMSAEPNGREFGSPFERPTSANLGSARGRFGSSNLFPRPDESLAFEDGADVHLTAHDWPGSSLLERMEMEHEMMRRQFAQRRHQRWKGSTPSLNEIRPEPPQATKQQQPQQFKCTSDVFEASSGGSLRQSTPLDSAPIRRNTANLHEQVPLQRMLQMPQRTSSKTSIITSKLANIQLSQPDESRAGQYKSSKFIELKRDNSAAVSAPIASRPNQLAQNASFEQHTIQRGQVHQVSQQRSQQRQHNDSIASSSSQDVHWAHGETTPRAACLSSLGSATQTRANPQADNETNSRIQSWLLQSSDNLSISSGSKSSASDATLPSSSGGRSDLMAAQLPIDRAILMGAQLSQPLTTRTRIGSQLPPTPSRSSCRSAASSIQTNERSPRPIEQPVSMIVRSSSRKSLRQLEQPGHAERHKVHETTETFLTDHSANRVSTLVEHSTAASSSSLDHAGQRPQRCEFVETRSMVTSSRQIFNQRATSPLLAEHQDDLSTFQGANSERAQPTPQTPLRLSEDFNDFDSLLGSAAELNSRSSSSLLEQLRSRGYRSMMNQRIMTPGVAHQQQPLNQQADPTMAQPISSSTAEQEIAASSSNSLNSSGVFASQSRPLDERPSRQRELVNEREQTHSNKLQTRSQSSSPQVPQSAKKSEAKTIEHMEIGSSLITDRIHTTEQSRPQAQEPNELQTDETIDLDEDVREAKANIKKYLDRVRETEQFIKSIQEEEDRFQRQQQESFLFNNLLLHTKFNGFSLNGWQRDGLDWNQPSSVGADSRRAPQTAPIMATAKRPAYSTASQWDRPTFTVSSTRARHVERPSRVRNRALSLEPTVSCFSAELYKPLPSDCRTSFAKTSTIEPPDLVQTGTTRYRYASPAPNRRRRASHFECGQLSSGNESDSLDDDPEISAYRPSRYVSEAAPGATCSRQTRSHDRSKSVTRFDKLSDSDIVAPGTSSRLSELEQRIQANKRRREELLQRINSDSCEATS